MAEISKEFEIELSNGRTVDVNITVEASYEADYGADADGNRGMGLWSLDGHSYEVYETLLSDEEKAEVEEQVQRLVDDEPWDFDEGREADYEADEDYN